MSELDNLTGDAEKYAKDHPDQVKESEQDVEKKLGVPGQQDQAGSGSTSDGDNAQDSGNQQQ
jgi:hypothetical protein